MISCLTITKDRPELFLKAWNCFCQQTYEDKELVVICDGSDEYKEYLENLTLFRPDVNLVFLNKKFKLGELRNISVDAARGDYVCQWDDDELNHKDRLQTQFNLLKNNTGTPCCCFTEQFRYIETEQKIYWLKWPMPIPGTLMGKREFLVKNRYPPFHGIQGEDSTLVNNLYTKNQLAALANPVWLHIYVYHGNNTWDMQHQTDVIKWSAINKDKEQKEILEKYWPNLKVK